jgi:hypothetical protein
MLQACFTIREKCEEIEFEMLHHINQPSHSLPIGYRQSIYNLAISIVCQTPTPLVYESKWLHESAYQTVCVRAENLTL